MAHLIAGTDVKSTFISQLSNRKPRLHLLPMAVNLLRKSFSVPSAHIDRFKHLFTSIDDESSQLNGLEFKSLTALKDGDRLRWFCTHSEFNHGDDCEGGATLNDPDYSPRVFRKSKKKRKKPLTLDIMRSQSTHV